MRRAAATAPLSAARRAFRRTQSPRSSAKELPTIEVRDLELGTVLFPAHDRVMAPWITEHGVWEPVDRAFMQDTLWPGAKFLNVGANIGYHVLFASRLVGPTGRVYAVEPDPVNFTVLRANLALHGVTNVKAICCAAGTRRGSMHLYRSWYNAGDSRLFPFDDASSSVKVRVRRLDRLLRRVDLDSVLVDTQGWDHEVVAGMGDLLKKMPPIDVEYMPPMLREMGVDPIDVVRRYERLGYTVGMPQAGIECGSATPEDICRFADEQPFGICNLELRAP